MGPSEVTPKTRYIAAEEERSRLPGQFQDVAEVPSDSPRVLADTVKRVACDFQHEQHKIPLPGGVIAPDRKGVPDAGERIR
jgi:hypothetical protein